MMNAYTIKAMIEDYSEKRDKAIDDKTDALDWLEFLTKSIIKDGDSYTTQDLVNQTAYLQELDELIYECNKQIILLSEILGE